MRQGQQNRRGRGRGGRKPQNPLARNYESNGPDVKIRGTAAHIAEKYMSLARDALASGDMVVGRELSPARRALQSHHHGRADAVRRPARPASRGDSPNGGSYRNPRWNSEGSDDDGDFDEGGGGEIRAGGGGDIRPGVAVTCAKVAAGRIASAMPATASITPADATGTAKAAMAARAGAIATSNGSDQPEAHQPDETAPDPVS